MIAWIMEIWDPLFEEIPLHETPVKDLKGSKMQYFDAEKAIPMYEATMMECFCGIRGDQNTCGMRN